jgi:hypothetical protein
MAPGLAVRGALGVIGLVGIGGGGGDEVSVAIDVALRGIGLARFVALVLGNRGQGASGFFSSGETEAESGPETARYGLLWGHYRRFVETGRRPTGKQGQQSV